MAKTSKNTPPYQLVIVESADKCDTFSKILEENVFYEDNNTDDYLVASCTGLVRDLSLKVTETSRIVGVNVENDYEPVYELLPGKEELVTELSKLAREARQVVLATDEGGQGEAIAWHLMQVLPKDIKHVRITYSEITVQAILDALKNAHTLDLNLVEAEETQRILNRLAEYTISPVVRRSIAPDLSAGREASLGLKVIVERERERLAFQPKQYWNVRAAFFDGVDTAVEATLVAVNGVTLANMSDFSVKKRLGLTYERAEELIKTFSGETISTELENQTEPIKWTVTSVQPVERTQSPPLPFTTSTLLKESCIRLGMSVSHTVQVAKYLYETGHITYLHTGSVHLSEDAQLATEKAVTQQYGSDAAAPSRKANKRKKSKEAIRPALQPDGGFLPPDKLKTLDPFAARLYGLIYQRTLASRMKPLVVKETTVTITGTKPDKTVLFQTSGTMVIRPGYTSAWEQSLQHPIPNLTNGQTLECTNMVPVSRSTLPPPRYTEASFVRQMEAQGLGRPAVSVRTIQTLRNRRYIRTPVEPKAQNGHNGDTAPLAPKSECKSPLVPSLSAFVVCSFLEKNCQNSVDLGFTVTMNRRLGHIAQGAETDDTRRVSYLDEFYAGENGLAAQMERIDNVGSSAIIRKADLPEVFLNNTDEEDIGLFFGPEGPYVQNLPLDEAEEPTTAPLPPNMAADISAIDQKALRAWIATREPGGFFLGTHPEDGRSVRLKVGMQGAYLLWGEDEGATLHELPKHIGGMQSIDDEDMEDIVEEAEVSFDAVTGITLEDALQYLPRTVCKLKKKPIVAAVGPYGPYLKYKHTYVRLCEKDGDVRTVDAENAKRIIKDKVIDKTTEQGRGVIAELGEKDGSMVQIREGRLAMRYITWKKMNAKLPEHFQEHPDEMTMELALTLLQKKKAVSTKKLLLKSKSYRGAHRRSRKSNTSSKTKKPKSAYLHFCEEKKPEIAKQIMASNELPNTKANAKISKELARQWEELGAKDDGVGQRKYEIRAAADQARYKEEMTHGIPETIETSTQAGRLASLPDEEKKDVQS